MQRTKGKPKLLVLLDAHAIIHRAYHALPEFLSSSGEPTGALYGLATMLMRIITELKPDYIVACYDLPGKTFRHEAYDGYKAKRVKADDALVAQLKNSREIFEAFGIPIYDAPGFEADDVIGTIVQKLKIKNSKLKIIIASGDMDTMQLVDNKKVQVYTLKKGLSDTILYDEDKVVARFGFKPTLLPDYKGLRGDPSDNIVGIKGIGEKMATDLILKFGTIEEIYKQFKIKNYELRFKEAGFSERIINLIKESEEEALFSKTLGKIRLDAPVKFNLPDKTFWQSADPSKIEQVFSKFEFRSLFARIRKFFGENGGSESLLAGISPKDESVNLEKLREVSVALWLINSDLVNPNLEDILLFAKTDSFEKAHKYIFEKLKEKKLLKVYEEIERPIMPLVKEMEDRGILIDKGYFEKLSREYHKELDILVKKIHQMAGGEFNINSPKQLAQVLFEKLGLKRGRRGASGAYSTKIEVLEELAGENLIVREIMRYRELQKLLSTYIDVIPQMVGPDGRLHAKFLQNGTVTGRFSSQDPNLQNLPIKSDLGKRIRGGFIAGAGRKLAAFDYSQIELRVAAMLSKDLKMTAIFKDKKDVHAGVASFVFGVPVERVTAEMRRQAKVINFGILYGMGVSALRKNLGGSREEAQKFYDNYFRQFSGLSSYLEGVKSFALKNSYTETLFGRRRNFPNISSRIPFLKNMAERTAINAPIQGTAADIIKLAIRYAHEDLAKAKMLDRVRLVLVIHDELVYEVEEGMVGEAAPVIKEAMENVLARSCLEYKSPIPLAVHEGVGDNLGEVK